MHIILTHEQADFDAVASQLGAYLLDDRLIPVLSHRLNRNVRAFLTIYGVELPFVERRDLPGGRVAAITLVDAQTMISVKGAGAHTSVQVIDHHSRREDLPAGWQVNVQPTGANATILVEALREQHLLLTPIQATLLLLGIYEDTGSLTYTRTTPRDLLAAAYLLEQGASLRIAGEYLNHPLSLAQQTLYDRLRQQAETHLVHGHSVVVAAGDATGLDEELSSIAHKLRDLLDSAGLFVLLQIHGGVQLIARSTSDHLDVAEVATHFGGGGHSRAAAALIKDTSLKDAHTELLRILPAHVRPAITVAQIMSRTPQTISPETPAQEAAQRMQRYGYEGYPVVEAGQVIGLLTRRAVDRALSHKLNLPARNLMEAGKVTATPGDPIESLQRQMIDTGWGQIPVVDPQSGELIGIVTRTDLLKTLAPEPALPGRYNFAARLESALPPAHLALLKAIAAAAHRQHNALYVVGGFVRDLILERPSLDFDLVVEGNAIRLAKALAAQWGGRVTAHTRFGTAKWFLGPQAAAQFAGAGPPAAAPLPAALDFITARMEFYAHPTALPTVERGSIKLDLHRRDFTINTLALRLDGRHYGELHDYWGGYTDIQQGAIRVLHSISFVDDPTRMLRAVRFEQRFGFAIEPRTLDLLRAALPLLARVSGDRIRHELDAMLAEPGAPQMLDRLHALGLLTAIHEHLPWDGWTRARIEHLPRHLPDPVWGLDAEWKGVALPLGVAYTLWLARVPVEAARAVARRLQMSLSLQVAIEAACNLWQDLPALRAASPSQVAFRLADQPALALYALYLAAPDEEVRQKLHSYAARWQHMRPTITGHDLRARGLPPGPAYRTILNGLRRAWLDGEITTPAEEAALLEALLSQQPPGG